MTAVGGNTVLNVHHTLFRNTDKSAGGFNSGEHVFNDMYRVVKPLFPKGAITTAPSVIYETLAALWREGRVKIRKEYVEGARPDLKAPLFKISLYK